MDQMAEAESGKPFMARTRGNLLIVGAIVVLAGLAIGLLVTLLMR
jgi:hypothetical protein